MKRWLWLSLVSPFWLHGCEECHAAVQYMVVSGSHTYREYYIDTLKGWPPIREECGNDINMCKDLAAVLNEAHEKRTQPKGPPQLEDVERCVGECLAQMKDGTLRTGGGYKDPGSPPAYDRLPADKPFNYKDACGQDDCGVDPK